MYPTNSTHHRIHDRTCWQKNSEKQTLSQKLANKKKIKDRYEYTNSVATQNGHGLRIMTIPPKKKTIYNRSSFFSPLSWGSPFCFKKATCFVSIQILMDFLMTNSSHWHSTAITSFLQDAEVHSLKAYHQTHHKMSSYYYAKKHHGKTERSRDEFHWDPQNGHHFHASEWEIKLPDILYKSYP